MKGKHKIVSLLLTILLSFGLMTPQVVGAEPVSKTVKLIHTNDVHGRINDNEPGALASFKAFIDANEPLLLLDGGDMFQGLPISNISKGADMAEIAGLLGYDAVAVGNHEFDFGLDVALGKVDGFGKSLGDVPLLSANTIYKDTKELVFKPSVLVEKDGYTVPIVGVTTPETAVKTHPDNVVDVTWLDPFESVKKQILRDDYAHADFFVVVSHLGVDSETAVNERGSTLAQRLSEDEATKDLKIIIIDGHSHSKYDKQFGNVLLVQTGEYLKNIGLIEVDVAAWKLTPSLIERKTMQEAYPLDGPDVKNNLKAQEILGVIDCAEAEFKRLGGVVVFKDYQWDLSGNREVVRREQAPLGTLISDSLLAYSVNTEHPADFAVMNGGGIRADLNKGDVTVGDLISILPFGNIYSSIEVSGADVLAMLEHSYQNHYDYETGKFAASGAFLQLSSNLRVVLSATSEPLNRVRDAHFVNAKGDLVQIVPEGTYRLATNDFLAIGGDGYTMLGGPRVEGESLDAVLTQYFEVADLESTFYTQVGAQSTILSVQAHKLYDEALFDVLYRYELEGLVRKDYTDASYDAYLASIERGFVTYIALNSQLERPDGTIDESHFDMIVETFPELFTDREALIKMYDALIASLDDVNQKTLDDLVLEINTTHDALVKVSDVVVEPEKPAPTPKPTPKPEVLPETGLSSFNYQFFVLAGAAFVGLGKRKRLS